MGEAKVRVNTATMRRLKRVLHHAAEYSPLFRERLGSLKVSQLSCEKDFTEKVPLLHWEDLEDRRTSAADPYGGRAAPHSNTPLTCQLENDAEFPLYVKLSRNELQRYADALTHCWQLLSLNKGDKVAIFDYGSSPLSYLASSSWMPYLSRGAADSLGCIPICNDGVSQMSYRALEIVRLVRPKVFFLRSDCLFPFSQEANRQGVALADYIGSVVVAENDGLTPLRTCLDWEKTWGIPVYRLLRVDAAMFLGLECLVCHMLHVPDNLYFVEAVSSSETAGAGYLAITNLFARSTPAIRYVSQVSGLPAGKGCPEKPEDERIKLL